jgi:catechol 2,3-dioxygenase-like lactoylglutathione lyase family enzyme
MLRPKMLDHVGLVVSDIDRSLRFYQALGLEVLRRSAPDSDRAAAVLAIGDQEINMFCNPTLAAAGEDAPQKIDHFCLTMQSATIEEVVAELHAAGIEIAKGPVERRDGASLFVSDPDGVRVELAVKR